MEELQKTHSISKLKEIAQRTKVLVLFSGGIDSTVLLYLAKACQLEVTAIEFFYDGRPEIESECIKSLLHFSGIPIYQINYPVVSGISGKIPVLLESNAFYYSTVGNLAAQIGAKYIMGGQILTDWKEHALPNATPEYYNLLNHVLKTEHGERAPVIILPFLYLSKNEVVEVGIKLKVPFYLTWSCAESSEKQCGKCSQCIERQSAFDFHDIKEVC